MVLVAVKRSIQEVVVGSGTGRVSLVEFTIQSRVECLPNYKEVQTDV